MDSRYVGKKRLSVMDGLERVLGELGRMGIGRDDVVISTNVPTRLDGLPRRDRVPSDPGAAVYWRKGKQTRCMAIDRCDRVEDNLAAIAATLEAMRAIERHGGAEILDRAFTGFVALPSLEQWFQVLGVWRTVTDQGIRFERGKTGKLLHIKGADVLAIVKELRQERPQLRRFLICNRKGGKYTLDGFQSQWRRALERAVKAGLKQTFRFHDLRAKSASDAKSDQEAADRLGHGDVELTREVYRRLPREAEALSILDRLPKSAKEAE